MRRIVSTISVFIVGISLYVCATMASEERLPNPHPVKLSGQQPVCTNCHKTQDEDFPYAQYNHTSDFRSRHSSTARENERTCQMCHQQTFCSDCHATRDDKASIERLPATHPVEIGEQQPVCTNCHKTQDEDFPYAQYNHTSDFRSRHSSTARENERTCQMCHQQTFCSDCHATRDDKASAERLPATHPVNLGEQQPVCTNCHKTQDEDFPYTRHNHTSDFGTRHRFPAFENERACKMCHQQKFCSDCHAARTELKPSTHFPDKTTRHFPHRGDYLTRHRVDGKLNPVSCIRCHGTSATSKLCRRCHG